MRIRLRWLAVIAATLGIWSAGLLDVTAARAETVTLGVLVRAPSTGRDVGSGTFWYDTATRALRYQVAVLPGLDHVASASVNGPGRAGFPALAQFGLQPAGSDNLFQGAVTLTPQQAQELLDGALFVQFEVPFQHGIAGQIIRQ